tara:strand:+ start:4897 stop:5082 length:186 start_codon:yes stop_codon:yes gene_type:complete
MQAKFETLGIKITREEHYDSQGRIRLFWVLRDEEGHIDLMTKTWQDMVEEMMWARIELNRV